MTETVKARFGIGEIVQHELFKYRGVIIDVDARFQGDELWYCNNTSGNPPKDKPWYHILVHGSVHHAYAAEVDLIKDSTSEPVEHPELNNFFDGFKEGVYRSRYTN